MDDQSRDNPGVIAFPPLLFASTLAAGLLLHWLMPKHPFPAAPARVAGGILLVVSVLVAGWGRNTMRRAGTNVNPSQPALALVTGGPFRFSRNPLYLSITGFYLGVTLLADALCPLVLLVPLLVVAHYGIVLREERYLEAKFGESYRSYRAKVRRWV